MNIFKDIAAAGKVFGEIRKARKFGADGVAVKMQPTYSLPVVNFSLWGFAWEACIFSGQQWKPIRDLFDTFDEKTQNSFTYAPKDGEFTERVRFWKGQLRSVLPPALYHEAVLMLIHSCIRIVKLHKEAV